MVVSMNGASSYFSDAWPGILVASKDHRCERNHMTPTIVTSIPAGRTIKNEAKTNGTWACNGNRQRAVVQGAPGVRSISRRSITTGLVSSMATSDQRTGCPEGTAVFRTTPWAGRSAARRRQPTPWRA